MTMRDYLCQQCEEMLVLERGNMKLSEEMVQDSRNPWLLEMLKNQQVLIWQRLDNLQSLVQVLGGKLRDVHNKVGEDALLAYHQWKAHKPSQEVLDLHNMATMTSIIEKDIPLYRNIANLAHELKIEEVALTVDNFITDQQDYLRTLRKGMPAFRKQMSGQARKAA